MSANQLVMFVHLTKGKKVGGNLMPMPRRNMEAVLNFEVEIDSWTMRLAACLFLIINSVATLLLTSSTAACHPLPIVAPAATSGHRVATTAHRCCPSSPLLPPLPIALPLLPTTAAAHRPTVVASHRRRYCHLRRPLSLLPTPAAIGSFTVIYTCEGMLSCFCCMLPPSHNPIIDPTPLAVHRRRLSTTSGHHSFVCHTNVHGDLLAATSALPSLLARRL
ncbi:hypothetical protein ZIOFF_035421 [Zingiber officinale]|uniref:Uncharacterized protein n=1 Tax=Zingiber officinale TaxID=94328 RepID=A0A8J5GC63_ZINOF|nr:hypothetical protein ZIOFF_035421 [Zingiber officinale]